MAFASAWTPVAAPTGRSPFLGGRTAAASARRPSAGPTMRNAISNDTYAPKVGLPTITPTTVPSRVGNPPPVRPIRANNLLNKFRVSAVGRAKALQQYADRSIDDLAVSDPAEAYMAAGVNVLYGDPNANAGAVRFLAVLGSRLVGSRTWGKRDTTEVVRDNRVEGLRWQGARRGGSQSASVGPAGRWPFAVEPTTDLSTGWMSLGCVPGLLERYGHLESVPCLYFSLSSLPHRLVRP